MKLLKDNFRKMYLRKTNLYNEFSWAEDKRNLILKFLLKKTSFKNKIVLDVGTGACKFPTKLSKYCKKIYALDPSQPLLNIGLKNIKKSGIKNIETLKGKVEKIPLKSKSVDIIISTWAFLQKDINHEKGFKEILRVLKKKGKIFIVESNPDGEFIEIWRKTRDRSVMEEILNRHLFLLGLYKFKKFIVKTSINFPSVKKTAEIVGFILGNKAKNYILRNKKSKINMNVAIFYGAK